MFNRLWQVFAVSCDIQSVDQFCDSGTGIFQIPTFIAFAMDAFDSCVNSR